MHTFSISLKQKLSGLATVLGAIVYLSSSAAAQGQYVTGTTGVDVSWPNCSTKLTSASFGIVGVTGGKGFSQNTCLKQEASHYSNFSLYTNTGYPDQSYGLKYQNTPKVCDAADLSCLAYNYGYNSGQYAISYANSQGLHASTWWLDVETMNSWTNDPAQNIQSLQGQTDALKAAGVTTVGAYSTTAQWQTITGGWQNGMPSWGATTWTTAKQAATYCTGHQFTGGPSWLMQYKSKLDQDYAC